MTDIICCTCLYKSSKSSKFVSLNTRVKIKNTVLELSKMLFDCIRVDYDEYDGLGNLVCCKCMKKISSLYSFRKTCLNSQKILRKELKSTKDAVDISNFVKVECELEIKDELSTELIEFKENDLDNVFNDDSDSDNHQDEGDCLADYDIRYNDDDNYDTSSDSNFDPIKSDDESLPEPEIFNEQIETPEKESKVRETRSKNDAENSNNPNSIFICDYCKKSFTKKIYLRKHCLRHIADKVEKPVKVNKDEINFRYVCDYCGKKFLKKDTLRKHYSRLHPKEKMGSLVQIKIEKEMFVSDHSDVPNIKIKKEFDTSNENQTEPSLEDDAMEEPSDKKLKLSTDIKDGAKHTFVCDFCGKRFFKKDTLRKHYGRLHKNEKIKKILKSEKQDENCKPEIEDPSFQQIPKLVTDNKDYICDICGEKFIKKILLKKHHMMHFRTEQGEIVKDERKIRKKITKSFLCDICGQYCVTESGLAIHRTKHSNDKPFQCKLCGKLFACRQYLEDHSKRHTDELSFFCDICHKGFTRKRNLQLHLRIHTGERPFQCTLCDKSFYDKIVCNRHIRTHAGERPYSEIEKKRGKRVRRKKTATDTPVDPTEMYLAHRIIPHIVVPNNIIVPHHNMVFPNNISDPDSVVNSNETHGEIVNHDENNVV